MKDLIAAASENVNFLKHANRDPDAVLETLTDDDVDVLLFAACHDFGRVAKGQPVEAQVFEAWYLAQYGRKVSEAPLRFQKIIRTALRHFRGIRLMDRSQKLALGWLKLQDALQDPKLRMEIQRQVVIPEHG